MPHGKMYILRGHEVVEAGSMLEGAAFFENFEARVVRKTSVVNPNDPSEQCEVSTVFLCIDHGFDPAKPPVVFETLVQGGPLDDQMNRYSTWDDALAGHFELVDAVRQMYLRPKYVKKAEAARRKMDAQRGTWHERLLAGVDKDDE